MTIKPFNTKKIGAVLVIGGGIAGIQSSLDLADGGFKVYLLEDSICIGGVMPQLDKTFPTNDCSMCIMAPKLVEAGRHQNIELITNSELDSVEGSPGNFKVSISKRPRYVDEEKCTGCGLCARFCPAEATSEYNQGLSIRGGIYIDYPQAVPLVFAIDKKKCIGCGLCERICEAKAIDFTQKENIIQIEVGSIVLAPGFEAFNPVIKKEYGYSIYKNVVTSMEFERLLSASGPYAGIVLRPSDGEIPKKVAFIQCVGSRDTNTESYCSSVCCMYTIKEAVIAQEHVQGLKCHIFFMDIRAFGKEFDDYYERAKNEHKIKFIRSRVASIEEIEESKNLLLRYTENGELKEEEFDLVVLGVGLHPPLTTKKLTEKLKIQLNKYGFVSTSTFTPLQTSVEGIYACGAFSSPKDIPDSVAQASGAAAIAGGIVASERGKLVPKKEYPEELVGDKDVRIGAFICHCGINIGGVVDVPSVVSYVKTLPNVVYAEDNLYTCSQDTQDKIKQIIKQYGLNRIMVASCTPRTHQPLFQETLRDAGLNPYLFEMANIRDQCSWVHMHEKEKATKKAKDLVRSSIAKARLLTPLLKSKIDVNNTALVIGAGLSGMTASLELAKQGFEVNLIEKEYQLGGNLQRIHYLFEGEDPQKHLKKLTEKIYSNKKINLYTSSEVTNVSGYVGNFETTINQEGKETLIKSGVIIVATGGEEYKPKEYFYGEDKRILTQLELEEKLAKNEFNANNIVMIQCVGSRNIERSYCSRICCSEAIKNALKIKEINPQANIYILYKDIRTYGFREDFYKEAANKGVIFIRYDDKEPEVENKDNLQVTITDLILKEEIIIKTDLLVLSTAIIPRQDNEKLAPLLKVPLSKDGFFLEAHMKLRPIDFATNGIFLCGLAHSPKFIDESLSQAYGTVSRAATILSKDKLEVGGTVAIVDKDKCVVCLTCVRVCPYNVPVINEDGVAEIEVAKCQGCGTCVGECPAKAIQLCYYTDEQIIAKSDALLAEAMG